jgi:hypothetical protein
MPSFSAFSWTRRFTGWPEDLLSLVTLLLIRESLRYKKEAMGGIPIKWEKRITMLTLLLGPFLALLPKRWRKGLPAGSSVHWRTATTLSGFGEAVVGLVAMMYWYSYSMTNWVDRGLDAALSGKMAPGVTDQEIGSMALVIFATHPLTWLIAYAGVEGSVRLVGAAFTETYLGIFPLFVVDKVIGMLTGRSNEDSAKAAGYTQGNVSSYVGTIREKIMAAGLKQVPDELCFSGSGLDELLEIRACRRKADWTPPRVVRHQEAFYRLEACSEGKPPRPYHYRLRRLEAGVMGRTVLVYSPEEPLVVAKR